MSQALHRDLSRQISLDFFAVSASPETYTAKELKVRVEIPMPSVLIGEPVPTPEKVKNVFDLYFDPPQPKVEKAVTTEPERLFKPDDYPDRGRNYFEWSEPEIIEMHIGLLNNQFSLISNTRTKIGHATKLEVLTWIFGEPAVQGYKWKVVDGKQTKFAIQTKHIPFTFYCACHLACVDPNAIQSAVESILAKNGELDLLDQI